MSTLNHQISQLEEKYNFRKAIYPLLHIVFGSIALISIFTLRRYAQLPPHLTPGVGGHHMPWIGLGTSIIGIAWFAWDQSSIRKALENMRAVQRDLKHNARGERYASLSIQRTVLQRSVRSRRIFQLVLGLPGVLFCLLAVGAIFGGLIATLSQTIYMGLIIWLSAAFYGAIGYFMAKTAWNLPKNQLQELGRIEDELVIMQLTQKAKAGAMSIASKVTTDGGLTDVTHAQSGQLTDTQQLDDVVLDFEQDAKHEEGEGQNATQHQHS